MEVLAELDSDITSSIEKWQKRKLKGLSQNYITKAEMAIQQSRAIKQEAEKNKLEIKIKVDELCDYILKGEEEEKKEAPALTSEEMEKR